MHNVRFSHIHSRKYKNIFYVFCLSRQSHSSIQKGTTHKSFFLSCSPFLPSCLSTPLCCMEKSLSCWPKFAFHSWKSYSCLWKRDSRAKASGYICYYFIPLYTSTNQKVVGSNPAGLTRWSTSFWYKGWCFSFTLLQLISLAARTFPFVWQMRAGHEDKAFFQQVEPWTVTVSGLFPITGKCSVWAA